VAALEQRLFAARQPAAHAHILRPVQSAAVALSRAQHSDSTDFWPRSNGFSIALDNLYFQ
jgi:hypothetical protein